MTIYHVRSGTTPSKGLNPSGASIPILVNDEGLLETSIVSPTSPFGSVHSERFTPIFQSDAVYGVNSIQSNTGTTLSGTATSVDGMFSVSTGTSIGGSGYIQSRKRLRYRAGQGVIARFTAMFTSQVVEGIRQGYTGTLQYIGVGHAEDGIFIGYQGTQFGILYSHHGKREIQTLTLTSAASSGSTVTVELNGVSHSVALTTGRTTTGNAYEIANRSGGYTGFTAEAVGSTVVFVANSAGDKAGAFSFSPGTTGSAATFAVTQQGESTTETFIPQSSFNGDKLDGTGASKFTINPSMLNVFEIQVQYLGAGDIYFMVEIPNASSRDSRFTVFHTLKMPNTLTRPSFGNPSFPLTMTAASISSTTDVSVKCASMGGFIEGEKYLHGNRFGYYREAATLVGTSHYPLLTIQNKRVYGGRTNQTVINLTSITASCKHNNPVSIYIVKEATLTGPTNLVNYSVNESASTHDVASTGMVTPTEPQLIWTGTLGETGNLDHTFTNGSSGQEIVLQPGETITVCAKTVATNAAWVVVGLNTKEDQ